MTFIFPSDVTMREWNSEVRDLVQAFVQVQTLDDVRALPTETRLWCQGLLEIWSLPETQP